MSADHATLWPAKHDIFGVRISATNYDELVERLIEAAQRGERALVDFMPVHGLIEGARDEGFRAMMNQFTVVAPDGQPVRWALNRFHQARLTDRVYGPELTWRLCKAAAERNVPIFLYGATEETLSQLSQKLTAAFPALKIAGTIAPPFRPLTEDEDRQYIQQINDSGAKLVFLGIGCPRQEKFAFDHRHSINGVQLCVGAAFDFHAGSKKKAPAWMQKRGLEWLFRLSQEPKRLWKRYLVYNSIYLWLFARESVRRLFSRQQRHLA